MKAAAGGRERPLQNGVRLLSERPTRRHALNYQSILQAVTADVAPVVGGGRVANYIPALARVPIAQFGIALRTVDGQQAAAGDATTPFSIQSVSKVLGLTLGLQALGPALWERIGREPSGNPFNSLVQLEREQGKPRNPFINAGALCVADRLLSAHADPRSAFADLGRSLIGEPFVFDDEVEQLRARHRLSQRRAGQLHQELRPDRQRCRGGAEPVLPPVRDRVRLHAAGAGLRLPGQRRRAAGQRPAHRLDASRRAASIR